jgi:2-oxoglutarate ferredoxin oxidoreductase subunit beta
MILAGVKNFLVKQKDLKDYAIVTGIGCHAKIFDYLNLPGINSLHGRALPTALGMKVGNPNLKILGFSGDGDAYAEGMEHTVHAARHNADFTYIVHNNQVFALTVGEPTPVTEKGFKDKTNPLGVKTEPFNPIKIMLACGASFVARVFAEVKQVEEVLNEASKHKGFKFIEILQPCVVFHPHTGYKEKTYNLQESSHDKTNWDSAMKKACEWDYDGIKDKTKIPLGIFYQKEKPTLEESWPQIKALKDKKKSFRYLTR